jgi:hypothetical protein
VKEGEPIHARNVRFLPIVSAYARTGGPIEEIDRLCGVIDGAKSVLGSVWSGRFHSG